ncbi:MAG: hypothetical protein QOD07_3012, partial [Frankiaceae bacterium]|nr:hypothetical protein [Frankiaceae bacterium]
MIASWQVTANAPTDADRGVVETTGSGKNTQEPLNAPLTGPVASPLTVRN